MSDPHGSFDGGRGIAAQVPGQPSVYGQRPAPAKARPSRVTVAGWMTIIMSGLTLALMGLATVGFVLAYIEPAAFRNTGMPLDDPAMMLAMTIYATLCSVLSLIAIPLGALVLAGSKVARALLTVVAILAGLASIPAAVGVLGVIPLGLIVGSQVMLHRREANQWFASGDQQTPCH